MKNDLDEASQKLASLQSKLASTESILDSSRQEHEIALSRLESTANTIAQLKMDNGYLKESSNDYLSSIEKLEGPNKDLIKMKALNHDYSTEIIGVKEEIKALRETNKKHDVEKLQFADDIKQREAEIKRYEEKIKVLYDREGQLTEKLTAAQQPWQLFL